MATRMTEENKPICSTCKHCYNGEDVEVWGVDPFFYLLDSDKWLCERNPVQYVDPLEGPVTRKRYCKEKNKGFQCTEYEYENPKDWVKNPERRWWQFWKPKWVKQ